MKEEYLVAIECELSFYIKLPDQVKESGWDEVTISVSDSGFDGLKDKLDDIKKEVFTE